MFKPAFTPNFVAVVCAVATIAVIVNNDTTNKIFFIIRFIKVFGKDIDNFLSI
jgi:hypothetical protein